ncbi:MAG: glycosyltransferase [Actinomycetota bacterium]
MRTETPSVLAILVVKDGAPWLTRALASLARQTHPRLGVLAVDNGSTDGSGDVLEATLGPRRVIRVDEDLGFPAAVARATAVPAAGEADYLLLLHDDAALAPDAVARLVDTAQRVDQAGVVGPKVLDWDRPEVLLDIGSTTDRFGYPYSPLEEGEIDQGQYDALREVLFVSSAAMLVSREAWRRAGLPDERLRSGQSDLDFCWRVRLAGLRVLVNPEAVALHRLAGERLERTADGVRSDRYLAERGGLLSLLKNYRVVTLLWVLPLYAVQAAARGLLYVVTRHFDRVFQVLQAWGWNIVHLPGTVRRRIRTQRARRIPDREIGRFMAPAGARLQRWVLQASSLLTTHHERPMEDEEEPEAPPLRQRAARLATSHPVAVGAVLAILLTVVGFRDVLFVPRVEGGLLPVFPDGPGAFFREFASGWRSTGFGGAGGASPALVPLGIAGALTLADPHLLARLLVALTPAVAGVACYRSVRRLTEHRGAAVVAAAAYALSALTLWAASEGSIPVMALLVTLPWLSLRLGAAFDDPAPAHPFRWVVATGAVLAAAASFFPATWLSLAVVAAPMLLAPSRNGNPVRGVTLGVASGAVAAVLVFPFAIELARAGGGTEVGALGLARFADLLRLSPGRAPGSWLPGSFLPVAAVLAFPFAAGRHKRWGGRSLLAASASLPLAWLAAAGYLPAPFSNPIAYLAAAAFSMSVVVGLAIPWILPGLRRAAFGFRQLAVATLAAVLFVGIAAQAVAVVGAGWAVRPAGVPPAWPVVATSDPGQPFRVLWVGRPDSSPFPAPGGQPQGTVEAGPASVSYAITGRGGRPVLALGLPARGPGDEAVRRAVGAMLSGQVRHGGALLAPAAIRYVVAPERGLPPAAASRLDDQLDLDLVQAAGGLRIYRNARALPVAGWYVGERAATAARSSRLLSAVTVEPARANALEGGLSGWGGTVGQDGSLVSVADQFDDRWRLEGPSGDVEPFPAFGWAVGFESAPGEVTVRFGGQLRRTLEVAALAALWVLALVVTRRRSRERAPFRAGVAGAEVAAPVMPAGGRREVGAR